MGELDISQDQWGRYIIRVLIADSKSQVKALREASKTIEREIIRRGSVQ